MEWIRNWLLMCPLEHDIEVVKILKSHIGKWKRIWLYMLMGWTLGWALDMCGLGHLVQIIIIIFIILFFELVSLYTTVISKTVYLFSNVFMHSPSFMKNNFWETLPERKYFCTFIWVKERERDIECFTEHGSCVLLLCTVDNFILGDKRLWVSKYHRLCEWRNLL